MNIHRAAWTVVGLGLLLPLAACQQQQAAKTDEPTKTSDVALQVVKTQGYLKAIESLRGKVVLVDIWGEF